MMKKMSATNHTTNLQLSQFEPADKPTWLGDYNADMKKIDDAVESIKESGGASAEQITALESAVGDLKTNVNQLQTSYNANSVAIQQNAQRITETETVNAQQNSRLDVLEDDYSKVTKTGAWVIVGDSYATGSTVESGSVGYMTRLLSLNPTRTIYNASKSGAGFTKEGNTFLQNLQAIVSTITDLEQVTAVAAIGGGNDIVSSAADINNAISTFVQYVKSTFPNATVYVGFLNGNAGKQFATLSKAQACGCYMNAEVRGATYIKGIDNIAHNFVDLYAADGIHPNNTGAIAFSYHISSFLNTHVPCTYCYREVQKQVVAANNITLQIVPSVYCSIQNDMLSWRMTQCTFSCSQEITTTDFTELGSYDITCENMARTRLGDTVAYDTTGNTYLIEVEVGHQQIFLKSLTKNVPPNTQLTFELGRFIIETLYA